MVGGVGWRGGCRGAREPGGGVWGVKCNLPHNQNLSRALLADFSLSLSLLSLSLSLSLSLCALGGFG